MTILDLANKFPPCICRFLARKKNGYAPMSVRELAIKSGLSKSKVAQISILRSWTGLAIDEVVRFSQACGVDLLHPKSARRYFRQAKRVHLEYATPIQKKFFQRLFTQRG